MGRGSMPPRVGELDEFIAAYELTKARDARTDWTDFLPARDHPLYAAVLRELVRIDLEASWDQGQPRRLEDYQRRFPELAEDRDGLREIAFEEFRLRCQAGEKPSATEYQERYGIATEDWSLPTSEAEDRGSRIDDGMGLPRLSVLGPRSSVLDLQSRFPKPGESFLGFQLLAELGRGTFGRVYLARQGDLANRYVALKVATDLYTESQTLAQLQHTHIMPIYSIHQAGPLQAVCMPFLGATTLADVFKDLQKRDSLPASGRSLVQTLNARRSATCLPEAERGTPADAPPPPTAPTHPGSAPAANAEDGPTANLHMLARLTHVQAVLWIAARVADGLAHAHARGILHRDLKPANVLLTDEGQPMLLDFNLSADTKLRNSPSAALLGGTLPYMAPEHLDAYQGAERTVDARSDLYSLGIILYEMLAGRPPYTVPRGPLPEMLARMSAARREPPPDLRRCNRAVSPAVAAIVRRCLEPDPARRYQSARELREDLECQLADRPLRYAPEPSWRERAQKWHRRHPRLTSLTTAVTVALLAVLGLGGLLVLRGRELARLEARESWHQLDEDLKGLRFLLYHPEVERRQLEEGAALCRRTLERYRLPGTSSWQDLPAVRLLAPAEQRQLRDSLGELLFLDAQVNSWRLPLAAGPRQEQLDFALRLNELAITCYAPEARPRALALQRARLLRLAGREDEAQRAEVAAEAVPLTEKDRYLVLADQLEQGQWRTALPALAELSRQEPQNYSWWLLLGNCHGGLGHVREAADCYEHGIALRPNSLWAYFNRGLLYLEHQEYAAAQADFDQVLRLRPDLTTASVNRALARFGLKDYHGALADLTQALEAGTSGPRVYFIRARVRKQLGDPDGARQDREEGLRLEPRDEKDWVARGMAQYASAPREALADFEKALELNPRSRAALQDKASVLSEKLDRPAEALAVLDRVVALYPDYVPARAGRGVLLARQGRRDDALTDARESLARTKQPALLYQVAGIYSLTSRAQPQDRSEALRLLAAALSQGYGLDLLDRDKDLDPIRRLPEFRRLVEAARALHAQR